MSLRQGTTLDNRYVLIERLGQGGQGSVWKALDKSTRETRAVKILDFADRDSIERAHREAELVTRERHPALITCHSLFRVPAEDMLVLVFDFVESIQLSAALREERFGRAHRLAALRHIAGALAYLHGRRIVHRDLKPDNVLVTPVFWEDPAAPSSLKIIDFGIAGKPTGQDGATLSGMFGTAPYMAPELFSGADVDAQRSPSRDVFAFGVIGWELLHGGHPTGLSSRAGASAYRETYRHFGSKREAWPPDELAGRWGSTVAACLALEPAMRPTNGRAILDLLDDRPPSRAASHSTGAATEAMREEASAPPHHGEAAGATAKHRAPSSTSSEEAALEPDAPSPAGSRARPSAERSSPATVASAPATAAVAQTEIAPVISLPRASSPDRTTPMPPAISSVPVPPSQRHERAAEEDGTTNGSQPPTPSPDGSRKSGPAETIIVSAPRVWPIVALAIALAVAVAGILAWALLVRSKGVGRLGTSSSSGGIPPSPPVWLAPPSSKSANETGASSATTSTAATSTASGTSSSADALIACCDKGTPCPTGRTCKGAGQCTKEVPDSHRFALRIVDVSREFPYENRKNLSDPDEYPASEVCVTVAASGQTVAATACLRMKAIAAKKEGARLDRIILRASDIREGRLSLQVSATGRKKAIDRPLQGAGLKSAALCGTVRLFDKSKEYSMAVYLDDPPSPAGEVP